MMPFQPLRGFTRVFRRSSVLHAQELFRDAHSVSFKKQTFETAVD
jgi:hypothetical protein